MSGNFMGVYLLSDSLQVEMTADFNMHHPPCSQCRLLALHLPYITLSAVHCPLETFIYELNIYFCKQRSTK